MTHCTHTTAGCSYPGGECHGACLADCDAIPLKPKALPTLIGLVGSAGCGKDTVRQILEQDHGYTGFAFADPLRAMIKALLHHCGHTSEWMDNRLMKEQPIPNLGASYRHLAQTLGTEWAHQCMGRDFWIRCADASFQLAKRRGERHIVFSDVRFQPEADWVRQRGGVLWRIHRPQAEPVHPHVSESAGRLIDCDLTLDNSGTLQQLWSKVHDAAMGRIAA